VPARQPDGEPAPSDGALPEQALAELPGRALGVYVHVPFCLTRCGYCDFNTYTAGDRPAFVRAAIAEVALAARVLGDAAPPVSTVFLGGGTPTILDPADLGAILRAIDEHLGLARDAEITVEANPDTVDRTALAALRELGATRASFGVQSVRPHVLAALDRAHDADRALEAIAEARGAGFDHVSADLIYGTPGETADDWRASLDAAVGAGVDHVSTYGLTIEPGTRLAARVRRGDLPAPDPDAMADRYAAADDRLRAAGLDWYELASWARDEDARCRHNLGYWRSASWWGIGPGAHSHVGGVRWWNVLHPTEHAARLRAGRSPARARERLDGSARRLERLLLELRLAEGLPTSLGDAATVNRLVADGLLERRGDRAALTLRGRLHADEVARQLA
jgi:oxygen-independent coproporphyrinogen-3 oxidase